MNADRLLLNIRTIDVSYRSALRHAPERGPAQQEWLGRARERADRMLNALESRWRSDGAVDARVALAFRVVRERIRRADDDARGGGEDGDGGDVLDASTP